MQFGFFVDAWVPAFTGDPPWAGRGTWLGPRLWPVSQSRLDPLPYLRSWPLGPGFQQDYGNLFIFLGVYWASNSRLYKSTGIHIKM